MRIALKYFASRSQMKKAFVCSVDDLYSEIKAFPGFSSEAASIALKEKGFNGSLEDLRDEEKKHGNDCREDSPLWDVYFKMQTIGEQQEEVPLGIGATYTEDKAETERKEARVTNKFWAQHFSRKRMP